MVSSNFTDRPFAILRATPTWFHQYHHQQRFLYPNAQFPYFLYYYAFCMHIDSVLLLFLLACCSTTQASGHVCCVLERVLQHSCFSFPLCSYFCWRKHGEVSTELEIPFILFLSRSPVQSNLWSKLFIPPMKERGRARPSSEELDGDSM